MDNELKAALAAARSKHAKWEVLIRALEASLEEPHEPAVEQPQIVERPQTRARTTAPVQAGSKGRIDYRAAIVQCGAEFDAHEVQARAGLENDPARLKRLSAALNYFAKLGRLKIVTRGRPGHPTIYQRGPKWNGEEAKSAERKLVDLKTAEAAVSQISNLKSQIPKSKETTAPPAMARMPEGTFRERTDWAIFQVLETANAPLRAGGVIDAIAMKWPELTKGANDETNLRVRLIDLAGYGRITREGRGNEARYSKRPQTAPMAGDPEELRVHVPRDPIVNDE